MIARVSLMRPMPGERKNLGKLLDELNDHASKQKGFVTAFHMAAEDDPDNIWRIAIFESSEELDRVATSTHVVALRSRIHNLIQPGHSETIMTIDGSKNLPTPAKKGA